MLNNRLADNTKRLFCHYYCFVLCNAGHNIEGILVYYISWVYFSEAVISYAHHLEKRHDMLLGLLFKGGTYTKLYSYRHLINGFAVHTSPEQVKLYVCLV